MHIAIIGLGTCRDHQKSPCSFCIGSHQTKALIKRMTHTSAIHTKTNYKDGNEMNSAQSVVGGMVAITEATLPC